MDGHFCKMNLTHLKWKNTLLRCIEHKYDLTSERYAEMSIAAYNIVSSQESFWRFICAISTATNMSNFYGSFFTLTFPVLLVGTKDTFLYETRALDNTYFRFKVQLPTYL